MPPSQAVLVAASLSGVPNSYVHKFGYSPDIDQTEEDVWEYGGTYTFLSTPSVLYASCSNASANQSMVVQGLDANWHYQSVSVTLNGQNQVAIPGTWLRCNRVFNNSATTLPGDVYIAEQDTLSAGVPTTASKVQASVTAAYNQSLMAIYTIPGNKTGYLVAFHWSIAKDQTGTFFLRTREFEKAFRVRELYTTVGQVIDEAPPFWMELPPRTDIKMSALAAIANTPVSATFDILLVDRSDN